MVLSSPSSSVNRRRSSCSDGGSDSREPGADDSVAFKDDDPSPWGGEDGGMWAVRRTATSITADDVDAEDAKEGSRSRSVAPFWRGGGGGNAGDCGGPGRSGGACGRRGLGARPPRNAAGSAATAGDKACAADGEARGAVAAVAAAFDSGVELNA